MCIAQYSRWNQVIYIHRVTTHLSAMMRSERRQNVHGAYADERLDLGSACVCGEGSSLATPPRDKVSQMRGQLAGRTSTRQEPPLKHAIVLRNWSVGRCRGREKKPSFSS